MKHSADNKTQELPGLPAAPKKRGRPSTGKAMTSAERKYAQRWRDCDRYAHDDWSSMTQAGLLEYLARVMRRSDLRCFDEISAELRRRLVSSDSHE